MTTLTLLPYTPAATPEQRKTAAKLLDYGDFSGVQLISSVDRGGVATAEGFDRSVGCDVVHYITPDGKLLDTTYLAA